MDDLSSRYLDAFNAIEKWLRTQVTSQERMDAVACLTGHRQYAGGLRRDVEKV